MWGKGLIGGLVISMRNMMRPSITVQYPYERLDLPERARWAVRPVYDEAGAHKCTACMTCVKVCPDHILDLEFTLAEDKTKHIEHFSYELGACMMCGLCVEACPFDAILMSHEYELAVMDPTLLVEELLTDVDAVRPVRAAAVSRSEHSAGGADAAGVRAPAEDSERRDGAAVPGGADGAAVPGGADGAAAPGEGGDDV